MLPLPPFFEASTRRRSLNLILLPSNHSAARLYWTYCVHQLIAILFGVESLETRYTVGLTCCATDHGLNTHRRQNLASVMAPRTDTKPSRPIQQQKPRMGFVSKATTPRLFWKPLDRLWTTNRLDIILKPRSLMAAVGGYDHVAPGVPIRPTTAARIGLSTSSGYVAAGCSSMFAAQASSIHSMDDVRHPDLEPLVTNSSNSE